MSPLEDHLWLVHSRPFICLLIVQTEPWPQFIWLVGFCTREVGYVCYFPSALQHLLQQGFSSVFLFSKMEFPCRFFFSIFKYALRFFLPLYHPGSLGFGLFVDSGSFMISGSVLTSFSSLGFFSCSKVFNTSSFGDFMGMCTIIPLKILTTILFTGAAFALTMLWF